MKKLVFDIIRDGDGGYTAACQTESIVTESDNLDRLLVNVEQAVKCHFDIDVAFKLIWQFD